MIKKNDKVCIDITDYTDEGLGIGRAKTSEGTFTLFVKDTAIGDRVEAVVTKVCKTYGYARLLSVTKPSPDRTDTGCPVASPCGGCSLRHISYEAQLKWKQKRVTDCMSRIGSLAAGEDYELRPIAGMDDPARYRNKAQYPMGVKEGRIVTGFYAGRTHTIIASDDCMIEPRAFADILAAIRTFAERNSLSVYDEETGSGLLRHVLLREGMDGKELMVCVIVNAPPGDKRFLVFEELVRELKEIREIKTILLSHNTKRTNVILGEKETCLYGEGRIRDKIGENVYEISARSFYQVNPAQTKVLYDKTTVAAGLTGKETVWDLYCGTGTISLFLAGKAREVYGVEIVSAAVEDAKRNAALNGISNAHFACGRAEDIIIDDSEPDLKLSGRQVRGSQELHGEGDNTDLQLPPPDVIVVDPPRKGCDGKLIETIAGSGAKKLVYVSCNPATLARDAGMLAGRGYKLKTLEPVDMFPHTTGVECVAEFVSTGTVPVDTPI